MGCQVNEVVIPSDDFENIFLTEGDRVLFIQATQGWCVCIWMFFYYVTEAQEQEARYYICKLFEVGCKNYILENLLMMLFKSLVCDEFRSFFLVGGASSS